MITHLHNLRIAEDSAVLVRPPLWTKENTILKDQKISIPCKLLNVRVCAMNDREKHVPCRSNRGVLIDDQAEQQSAVIPVRDGHAAMIEPAPHQVHQESHVLIFSPEALSVRSGTPTNHALRGLP